MNTWQLYLATEPHQSARPTMPPVARHRWSHHRPWDPPPTQPLPHPRAHLLRRSRAHPQFLPPCHPWDRRSGVASLEPNVLPQDNVAATAVCWTGVNALQKIRTLESPWVAAVAVGQVSTTTIEEVLRVANPSFPSFKVAVVVK